MRSLTTSRFDAAPSRPPRDWCGKEILEARSLMSATISGAGMEDVLGHGLSADDKALSGVVVRLYKDVNGNGTLEAADGKSIASKTTSSKGTFSFTKLKSGKYLLQDVPSSKQVRTAPVLSSTIAVNASDKNGKYGGHVFANYVKDFNRSSLTSVSYTINGTKNVSTLDGNVKEGDVVTANFTVAAGKTATVSLVSYHAPGPTSEPDNIQLQSISDLSTGTFRAGKHSLTVLVPDCYFQVDFVGGLAIDKFGPEGSNIAYGVQGRLIGWENGGTKPCECDCEGEEEHAEGRMTGGGSIFLSDGAIGGDAGTRVTHGFQLHCAEPAEEVNNRLEINWNKSKFHLETLTSVECFETALDQGHPVAPIDTLHGMGEGRFSGTFNGRDYRMVDAKIEFTLTDDGEPGRTDTSDYRIVVLDGNRDGVENDPVVVLDTNGPEFLTHGNHQAHKEIASLV